MSTRILIPVNAILGLKSSSLDLVKPARCSRCDAKPADFFETHPLKYQAGMIRSHQFNKKFATTIRFKLRLPLCADCYQANFLEDPVSLAQDRNPLGKIAHLRSLGLTTGSLFAGIAFILLMQVIPLPAVVASIKYFWLYWVGVAALIFGITLGLAQIKNQDIKTSLSAKNYNFKHLRAITLAKIQIEKSESTNIAVILTLENDIWAKECAYNYGWKTENKEPQIEKGESK